MRATADAAVGPGAVRGSGRAWPCGEGDMYIYIYIYCIYNMSYSIKNIRHLYDGPENKVGPWNKVGLGNMVVSGKKAAYSCMHIYMCIYIYVYIVY